MDNALSGLGMASCAPGHNQCVRKVMEMGSLGVGRENRTFDRSDVEKVVLANPSGSPLDCYMVLRYFLSKPDGVVPQDANLLVSVQYNERILASIIRNHSYFIYAFHLYFPDL
jgi:hypothetical protein